MSLAAIVQQVCPGHKGKHLENEHFRLQSTEMNSHHLVQDCIHFKIFLIWFFRCFPAVHSAIQNSLLLKTKHGGLCSGGNRCSGHILTRCLGYFLQGSIWISAFLWLRKQPLLEMQAHSQSWTVLWGTGMFSDLLPRKGSRVSKYNHAFLRASWFWIVTVVWPWQECLDQQQPLLGGKASFQPLLYPHHTLKWLPEHRNTRTDPRRQGLCQHSPHLTPFPAGYTKSRDSQQSGLLVLHISSITDKKAWKLFENTEHFQYRPLVFSYM